MDTNDVSDADRDRIEALRAELSEQHAGPYATVEIDDVLAYLLDLAEAVDDPDRNADPEAVTDASTRPEARPASNGERVGTDGRSPTVTFDRTAVRERLADRNRKHADPDDADRMDLYGIAAEFDVAGRSGMTKDELITAVLDRAAELATDPFAAVGVDVTGAESGGTDRSDVEAGDDGREVEESEVEESEGEERTRDADSDDSPGSGASQLDAMMSLLDTHDDKWREGDGDVRYVVDLPDGSVEPARTKDDVRALLFRNY